MVGISTIISFKVRLTNPFIFPTFFTKSPIPTFSNGVSFNSVSLNKTIRLMSYKNDPQKSMNPIKLSSPKVSNRINIRLKRILI